MADCIFCKIIAGEIPSYTIYEDDEFIVINKPSGLLSIESDSEKSNTAYRMLTDYVQKKDKKARIFIVHRIDKDTSGVLLVAKNEKIKNDLQHKWQDIVSKREYIAICEGVFKEKITLKINPDVDYTL